MKIQKRGVRLTSLEEIIQIFQLLKRMKKFSRRQAQPKKSKDLLLILKRENTNSIIAQCIMGTGRTDKDTDTASKCGLMELDTKVSGLTIKRTEEVLFIMLMVTYSKVIGNLTRLMEKEHTTMPMAANTKGVGLMICKMARGKRPGKIIRHTEDNTSKAKNTVKELMFGLMGQFTLAIGSTTKFKAVAFINGLMAEFMRGSGLKIRCMAEAI